MWIYWLIVVLACVVALLESDDYKLEKWHKRDMSHVTIDRIASIVLAIFALWRLYVETLAQ